MRKGKGIGDIGVSYDYLNQVFFSDIEHPVKPDMIFDNDHVNNSTSSRVADHAKEVLGRDKQPIDCPNPPRKRRCDKIVSFSEDSKIFLFDPVLFVPPVIVAEKVDVPPDIPDDLVANLGIGEEEPSGPDEFDKIDVNKNLPENEKSLFWSVLKKFRDVFRPAWGLLNDGDTMPIRLKDNAAKPIAQAPFRNSPMAKGVIDPILEEMRAKGRSRPSSSPWASPVFTVEQHGRRRMVIDFRRVNDLVERGATTASL